MKYAKSSVVERDAIVAFLTGIYLNLLKLKNNDHAIFTAGNVRALASQISNGDHIDLLKEDFLEEKVPVEVEQALHKIYATPTKSN